MNCEDRKMFEKFIDRLDSISHEMYEIKASNLGFSASMNEKMKNIEGAIFNIVEEKDKIEKRVRKIEMNVAVFMAVFTSVWAFIRFLGPNILKALRG